MKTYKLIELFELAKQRLINGNPEIQSGICQIICDMWIENDCTLLEKEMLTHYLRANKPCVNNEFSFYTHNIYIEFTKNDYWTDSHYWWIPIHKNIKTKQIRIDYLTELIKNIK